MREREPESCDLSTGALKKSWCCIFSHLSLFKFSHLGSGKQDILIFISYVNIVIKTSSKSPHSSKSLWFWFYSVSLYMAVLTTAFNCCFEVPYWIFWYLCHYKSNNTSFTKIHHASICCSGSKKHYKQTYTRIT